MSKEKLVQFGQIKLPAKVLYLQLAAARGIPVGGGFFDEVITEYPEYFPKEAERKRKWDAIPKEVHEAHWKEYNEFRNELWKDVQCGGGLMEAINHTEAYQKWQKMYERLNPLEEIKLKELHKKYYSKYGI